MGVIDSRSPRATSRRIHSTESHRYRRCGLGITHLQLGTTQSPSTRALDIGLRAEVTRIWKATERGSAARGPSRFAIHARPSTGSSPGPERLSPRLSTGGRGNSCADSPHCGFAVVPRSCWGPHPRAVLYADTPRDCCFGACHSERSSAHPRNTRVDRQTVAGSGSGSERRAISRRGRRVRRRPSRRRHRADGRRNAPGPAYGRTVRSGRASPHRRPR